MSKTVDTNLKFTTDTTAESSSSTTTTGTTVNFNNWGCKYYLPCGKCDKTGELCTHYVIQPQPVYPYYYPWWWEQDPWWKGPYYTTSTYTMGDKTEK